MTVDQTSSTGQEVYWDPWDYSLHTNSHPTWRRMREEAPLYYNERYDFYALTRFHDVLNALVDWRSYSSARGPIIELIRSGPINMYAWGLITEDPPAHTAHRQLMSRTFTPRAVKPIEDRVRAFVQHLLDDLMGSGGFDFVEDFGAQIPAMVIAAMLGTPDSDVDEIRHLTDASLHIDEGQAVNDRGSLERATDAVGEYFMRHVHARREDPTDDIMSALVTMDFTDELGVTRNLTDMEACQYIFSLSGAGNETVARFTGWAGAVLAQYPSQRAKLVSRPDLIANGVDKLLRFETPSMSLARVVMQEAVWYDQIVPKGSVICLVHAATGRDQRQFPHPDPDTFDVERPIDRHLGFGSGPHVRLARSWPASKLASSWRRLWPGSLSGMSIGAIPTWSTRAAPCAGTAGCRSHSDLSITRYGADGGPGSLTGLKASSLLPKDGLRAARVE